MSVETANRIIDSLVALAQGTVVIGLALVAASFFLQPELREKHLPMLYQWHLESSKSATEKTILTEARAPVPQSVRSKDDPPPPLFMPAPLPELEDTTIGFGPPPLLNFLPARPQPLRGKPVSFEKKTVAGIPLYLTTIDLKDPQMFISISLPHNVEEANSSSVSHGDEPFDSFVRRLNAAVVQNGTFFSKDEQKRVMGNMVADGRWLKYSQWENYGTTFGLKKGNEPEMITARLEGAPNWREHWFSLTCGPRLVTHGEVIINAEAEGFADPHVLGAGSRCAMGFPQSKDKIFLVTFLRGLTLKKEGEVMKAMGCYEAMNLDGGASKSLSYGKNIVVKAGRALTNVIVVYDSDHPAPRQVNTSWRQFQRHKAMIQLIQ